MDVYLQKDNSPFNLPDSLKFNTIHYQTLLVFKNQLLLFKIEQKGMTFDHNFGYSFPLFSSLLKKRGNKKRRMNRKIRDQKSCLSARSFFNTQTIHARHEQ